MGNMKQKGRGRERKREKERIKEIVRNEKDIHVSNIRDERRQRKLMKRERVF